MNVTEKDNSNYTLSIKGPPGAATFHPDGSMVYYVDHIQCSFSARIQAPPKHNATCLFTFYLKGNSSASSHGSSEKNVCVSLIGKKGASSSSSPAHLSLYKRESDLFSKVETVTCDASQIMDKYCNWRITFRYVPQEKRTECALIMTNTQTGYRHTQTFYLNDFALHTFVSLVIGGPNQYTASSPLVSMKHTGNISVSYGSTGRQQQQQQHRQKQAEIPVRTLIQQASQTPQTEKNQIFRYKDELSFYAPFVTKHSDDDENVHKAKTDPPSALRTHYAMALERPSERVKRVRVVCNGDTSEDNSNNKDANSSGKNQKGSIKTNFWDFLSVFIMFLLSTIAVKLVTTRICSSPTYSTHSKTHSKGVRP